MGHMIGSMTTQRVERGWVPEETFGGRLALIRQHFGWNVKEAAVRCAIAVESWRNWERDHVLPSRYLEVCRTIAEATGADYDWVLDGRRIPGPRNPSIPEYHGPSPAEKLTLRNRDSTASLTLGTAA